MEAEMPRSLVAQIFRRDAAHLSVFSVTATSLEEELGSTVCM